jgi:hypothetical protein
VPLHLPLPPTLSPYLFLNLSISLPLSLSPSLSPSPLSIRPDVHSLRALLRKPHALALVLTAPAEGAGAGGVGGRDSRGGGGGGGGGGQGQGGGGGGQGGRQGAGGGGQGRRQSLLMLTGTAPAQDTYRYCVPVMGLTTFLREWSALLSIRSCHLMPLAPYLLKASPVVSSQHLR